MNDRRRLEIDIAAESALWGALPEAEALAESAIIAADGIAGVPLRAGAEVSVLLTDDARIRELNRIWRKQDKPTNVLSFPAASEAALATAPMLGDIVIAFETVKREAEADGKPLADHLSHLAVHGFLHLLGFDHMNEAEALRMEGLETRILAALAIPDPYVEKS